MRANVFQVKCVGVWALGRLKAAEALPVISLAMDDGGCRRLQMQCKETITEIAQHYLLLATAD